MFIHDSNTDVTNDQNIQQKDINTENLLDQIIGTSQSQTQKKKNDEDP